MKHTILLILAIAMCLSLAGISASALENPEDAHLTGRGRLVESGESNGAAFSVFAVDEVAELSNFEISQQMTLEELGVELPAAMAAAGEVDLDDGSGFYLEYMDIVYEDIASVANESHSDNVDTFEENHDIMQAENQVTPYADLANLKVSSLKSDAAQPFPTSTVISFTFVMENTGGTAAPNIPMSLYANSEKAVNNQILGSLPANSRATVTLGFGIAVAGDYTLTVHVNENRTIPESNYADNTTSNRFTFGQINFIDPAAYDMSTASGITTWENHHLDLQDYITITFTVVNYGNSTAYNIPVITTLQGGELTRTIIPSLEANRGIIGRYDLSFWRAGTYRQSLLVDRDNQTNDVDRTNNRIDVEWTVQYDTHTFNTNGYPNGTTLTYYLDQSFPFTDATFKSAAQKWNGIGNISIGGPASYESSQIHAGGFWGIDPSQIAQGYSFDRNGNVGNVSVYVGSIITINLNAQGYDASRTITHEVGHILGLSHPDCQNDAIMHQVHVLDYATNHITDHDKKSVRLLY